MGPKYEFTDETMNHDGHILHQIKRLSDGKLGGWLEKEENLSQEGNCWVDNNAQVYEDARVYGNAKVYENAAIHDNAQVYGNTKIYGEARISSNAKVYGEAQVYENAWIHGSAKVYGKAKVQGNAEIQGSANVFGNAKIRGSARVFGNAQVFENASIWDGAAVDDDAKIYGASTIDDAAYVGGSAKVCGYSRVGGNAEVYDNAIISGGARVYDQAWVGGNAKVYGDAYVIGKAGVGGTAKIHGNMEIDHGRYESGTYYGDYEYADEECDTSYPKDYNENDFLEDSEAKEVVQDFIYKVDDSNKLTTQTEYSSIDEFFDTSIADDIKLDTLVICSVDTKESLIKLQKVKADNKTEFKFIVEITNEDSDDFVFRSIIKSQDQLNQLVQQTVDALRNYPKFNKYADDLEGLL